MKISLLVLAAGMGSRYGGLKQMDPVGPSGETVLDYSVHDALAAGFDRVFFVIRRDFEQEFRSVVVSRYVGKIDIGIVYQELADLPGGFVLPQGRERPWGTGHAIWCARNQIREPFLVVNADDFYGRTAFSLMAGCLRQETPEQRPLFLMVAYLLNNTLSEHGAVSRGICELTAQERMTSVEECTGIRRGKDGAITGMDTTGMVRTLHGQAMVSMNVWGFTPPVFPLLGDLFTSFLGNGGIDSATPEFYIPSAVTTMVHSGAAEVRILKSDGQWFGVTYREDRDAVIAAIAAMVEQKIYPTPLAMPPL